MTRKRIALVTCSAYPKLTEDDQVLAAALVAAGAEAVPADWRDQRVPWNNFDLAVVRSTWDYHLHAAEFAEWIDRAAASTRLLNPAPLVRWNMNKRYLAEIGARGIPVLPSVIVEPGAIIPVARILDLGWSDVVVKPLVGASAWQMTHCAPNAIRDAVSLELQQSAYMIQPYASCIAQGEYSLVYFDGEFSHAVLKTPRTGDFRTQRELGASQSVVQPDDSMVSGAAEVLRHLPSKPAYARIDGIRQDGRFVLMEAELIEPELYFRLFPSAAAKFASALLTVATDRGYRYR